ncbi:MAG: (d)CMP kinase [Candidatus Methylomirabilota bacterium]
MTTGKRRLVIAIDGPVGAGKSTAARRVAEALGYLYIDSGAMYRALGWKAVQAGVDLRDPIRLAEVGPATDMRVLSARSGPRVLVDGEDVTDALRTPAMDRASSLVSVVPEVRRRLVAIQRALAEGGGIVMDGRDIGTVVFPDADLKFYLDADPAVRATRRLEDLRRSGMESSPEMVQTDVARRDERDRQRDASPLQAASDAIRIDSTHRTAEEVVACMLEEIRRFHRSYKS